MKTDFNPKTIAVAGNNIPLDVALCGEFVTVVSLVGSASMQFTENGEPCPLLAGMTFRTRPGETFKRVWLKSGAGAAIVLIYGYGSVTVGGTSNGGGGGANGQIIIGAVDDPNAGNVVPGDIVPADQAQPAIYYKDADPSVFWAWSVTNQNWIALIQA